MSECVLPTVYFRAFLPFLISNCHVFDWRTKKKTYKHLCTQTPANRQSENVGPTLTQTVVPVVCQAKTIVASASVISWDVDALVDAAAVILRRTLVYICRDMKHRWGLAAAVATGDNRHTTMEPW